MRLPRIALLVFAALLWTACGDDDTTGVDDVTGPPLGQTDEERGEGETDGGEVQLESQASLGETIDYRGAQDTDDEWVVRVTAQSVECDVEVGEEVEVQPGLDRICAVHLEVENAGERPPLTTFTEASTVLVDDGSSHPVNEIASGLYAEEQGRAPTAAVPPGETAEQSLMFSVPSGTEPSHLRLQAAASDELVVIDLASDAETGS